ncbi:MAG: translational GTPase TypA [Candidatus Parcubacteria bacterium]|nr:translational GTPase TypA [Candidatus Parcubacteria bacterium]
MNKIRNIAIIAHVDHGKTTLVDALLRQSKTSLTKELINQECIMDSNDIEKERGITIFSKNAAIYYGDTKINIIDTPGHADFGGEVERVLNMADGCLLLIDAKEGPMPQTKFVLKKALAMGHKIIVVINKIDKEGARPDFALNATFDLFVELGAGDYSLDFPVIYASGREGKAGKEADLSKMENITPVFEAILNHFPSPLGDSSKPLQMLVTSISGDDFKGRICVGRVHNGVIKSGQEITHINRKGEAKKYRLVSLMTFLGLNKVEVPEVLAGDIAAIAGIPDATVGETIADPVDSKALPVIDIEEPTVKMTFMVNNSPLAGKEGQFSTSRQIKERLYKELETDVALRIEEASSVTWIVSGRGELHLAILIERMRREGFELQVSMPQVIIKEVDGQRLTPFERVFIETPEQYHGSVIQKLSSRKGEMVEMRSTNGTVFLEFIIPTQGLFGYRSEFMTDTKGMGIINTIFHQYLPDPGNWDEGSRGSLVSHETGLTNHYGLRNVQDRGILFFGHGVMVYEGQVVGQNSRSEDIRVNICKEKQLSNMRSKGDGTSVHINTPKTMGLEDALDYIGNDELVEITPKNIRIRKIHLSEISAKRAARQEREMNK